MMNEVNEMVTIEDIIITAKVLGFEVDEYAKEDFDEFGRIIFSIFGDDGNISVSRIDSQNRITHEDETNINVNWSACGSQGVEFTERFVKNLNNAAQLARILETMEVE